MNREECFHFSHWQDVITQGVIILDVIKIWSASDCDVFLVTRVAYIRF